MLPEPDTLPLWATNEPSPPMLVELPSKTGELAKSEPSNQFQYYSKRSGQLYYREGSRCGCQRNLPAERPCSRTLLSRHSRRPR